MTHVQFKDPAQAAIIAVFAGPQDPIEFPNQAEIDESDARYQAFVGQISGPVIDAKRRRALLLSASDWTVGNDSPVTVAKQAEWKTYRQALRDITSQSGFPDVITWPSQPV